MDGPARAASDGRRPHVCMLLERSQAGSDGRVRRAVRALAGDGWDVLVLHHGDGDAQPALQSDGARSATVRLRRRSDRGPAPPARGRRRPLLWLRYAWLAARARPDVVHVHDLPMLIPGWLAARAGGAAIVYDTHEYAAGVPYHSPLARRVASLVQDVLVPRCDVVVAASPEAAAQLRLDHGLAQSPAVVRNVAARSWDGAPDGAAPVADLRARLRIGDAPLVLHQGAATPTRGCVEIVEAVARLDGVHLLFMGDIEAEFVARLRTTAAAAGAAERLHVHASVPLEVLLAHTRQADVGVVLSDPSYLNHRLTLSNKLFEYIAAGLPVVGTRGTAFGALIERLGVGATAAFGDPAALASTLGRVLAERAEPGLRERLAAAAGELTWERERERLLEPYRPLAHCASRQSARSAV